MRKLTQNFCFRLDDLKRRIVILRNDFRSSNLEQKGKLCFVSYLLLSPYRPLPLLRVEIDKPDGSKRPLSIPVIRDRVLQTAITLALTPIFEEEFENISFAYRRGRSVNQAVSLIERLRDKGYQWVVDADIHRYFDQVNHDLLMHEVEKLVRDKGILRLIRQWLNATVVDHHKNKRYQLTKGIPQGSPLSPLLANLFLDQLDDTLLDKNLRLGTRI